MLGLSFDSLRGLCLKDWASWVEDDADLRCYSEALQRGPLAAPCPEAMGSGCKLGLQDCLELLMARSPSSRTPTKTLQSRLWAVVFGPAAILDHCEALAIVVERLAHRSGLQYSGQQELLEASAWQRCHERACVCS